MQIKYIFHSFTNQIIQIYIQNISLFQLDIHFRRSLHNFFFINFVLFLDISGEMNAFDGTYRGVRTCWAAPSSPSPRSLLAMLNQGDNNDVVDQINEIFPQTNHQPEQRSSLRERVAARVEFNLPPLETQNNRPFAAFFRNPSTTVPSPLVLISPGFSPSAMLQFPNMFIDPSHVSNNGYDCFIIRYIIIW